MDHLQKVVLVTRPPPIMDVSPEPVHEALADLHGVAVGVTDSGLVVDAGSDESRATVGAQAPIGALHLLDFREFPFLYGCTI
jgi:hypothetical protein